MLLLASRDALTPLRGHTPRRVQDLVAIRGIGYRYQSRSARVLMDVRQLKFFLAVVDHGGFSRAADELMVAQPSLSQAIAGFERELGMPLFHRVGRGVVLSDAGQALVGPARVVLRDIDEATRGDA